MRYIGDPANRIGYAIVACRSCKRGGHVSRMRAPEGAPLVPFADAARVVAELEGIEIE